jgi:trimeric autotransporter adhesin
VSAFAPGADVAGAEVSIVGANFDPEIAGSSVFFNGVSAEVISASASRIVARVPEAATDGPISVSTSQGTADSGARHFVVLRSVTFTTLALAPSLGGLACGGARLIAAGASTATANTDSPQLWSESEALDSVAVAWNGAQFVALGVTTLGTSTVSTSADGLSWTPRALPSSSAQLNGLAGHPAMWVAVGNSGRILSSPDAVTWTRKAPTRTMRCGTWFGEVHCSWPSGTPARS